VEAGRPDTKLNFPGETISEVPAKKRVRLNGSEEEQDGSEEEQDGSEEEPEHRERRLALVKDCKEIQQLFVAAMEQASVVAAINKLTSIRHTMHSFELSLPPYGHPHLWPKSGHTENAKVDQTASFVPPSRAQCLSSRNKGGVA
jgi:hypothetical protein